MGLLADHCLKRYAQEMGWRKYKDVVIDVQELYENVIYPEYEIAVIKGVDLGEYDGKKVLGKTILSGKEVLIDQSISDSRNPEFAWTTAHEIGHALLHTEQDQLLPYTDEVTIYDEYSLNEMHADCFAELLIIPHEHLLFRFTQHYGLVWNTMAYNGPGDYRFNQMHNYASSLIDLYQQLAKPLTYFFSNVSIATLADTMQKLRLVDDKTVRPIVAEKNENFVTKGSVLYNFAMSLGRK